jgi:phosphatidylglycerophosphate synthase
MELTLEDVKRGAKREDFRAGVQMRMLMPRLSVRVTRWVLRYTDLRPNHITLLSFAIGLAAAAAFASTSPLVVALGLAAFHLHVLLDYVDGEVARCRHETSVTGAYFDLVTDRITFPLLVFCAAAGAYRALGDPTMLVLGFVASFGLLADKEAVDCWYRANSGASEAEVEDRYVAAPARSRARR